VSLIREYRSNCQFLLYLGCLKLVAQHRTVELTRGSDFGPKGAAFVRLNIGTSPAIIAEAILRMRSPLYQ
jgi:bifunctional pyridoxal-dependent enzyme with beta-cystathionase and maltose regulon repressor activities